MNCLDEFGVLLLTKSLQIDNVLPIQSHLETVHLRFESLSLFSNLRSLSANVLPFVYALPDLDSYLRQMFHWLLIMFIDCNAQEYFVFKFKYLKHRRHRSFSSIQRMVQFDLDWRFFVCRANENVKIGNIINKSLHSRIIMKRSEHRRHKPFKVERNFSSHVVMQLLHWMIASELKSNTRN